MTRVRFAPSPTGYLHIGAARTSFFNWLFVRKTGGKFILRVEDTDIERSSEEMTRGILEGLEWLGMTWDEGPYFQSANVGLYRKKAEDLVGSGRAYYCTCSPGSSEKRSWFKRCDCPSMTESERNELEKDRIPRAIRFLVPEGQVEYRDLIHGPIAVRCETIEDFVLLRKDGMPTYHLSVVVDDIEHRITHVIRGDDHISNTPKQILLYKAFNASLPEFAHLALILGQDKKKLSKRHGEVSVLKYREEGYLPLAVLNYLAQMSWSIGDEKSISTVEEMVQRFSLDRLSKGSPVFSMEKLEWLNGQVISMMDSEELFPLVKEELIPAGLWREGLDDKEKEWFLKLIDLVKQRNRTLEDFPVRMRPFLTDDFEYDPEGVEKRLEVEGLQDLLLKLAEDFEKLDRFDAAAVEEALRARADREGVKAALLIHAVRMLVLGMPVSPGIFEVLELVGQEKTLARMARYGDILQQK